MTLYMLAEPQEQILKKVYGCKFQKPQIAYLFDDIDIVLPRELSPVLVQESNISKQIYQQILEKNAGLMFTSPYPQDQLLGHLRHILIINFQPDQLGVFRYYDPYIASYFFPTLNEQEKLDWLGPIDTIEWFNIDWRHKVREQDKWQVCHNTLVEEWQYNSEKLTTKPVLSKNQNLALQDMQEEKFAYQWQQNIRLNTTEVDIDTTIYWVKEAIHMGCWQTAEINHYLNIRSRYPTVLLPEQWPNQEIKQKLIYLEHYFQINN